jgi:hypothetical protein
LQLDSGENMKRLLFLIPLLLLAALTPAFGQTAHSTVMSWTASATVGVGSYNVYRAPCPGTIASTVCSSEGLFAKIGSTSVMGLTPHSFVDATVTAGSLYSYYVTAVCQVGGCSATITGESTASTHLGVATPFDTPLPPGNLSITSVARNSTGANTSVTASWADAPSVPTTYTFYGNGQVLISGTLTNATGIYTAGWTGNLKPGASISLEICDLAGACSSRLI